MKLGLMHSWTILVFLSLSMVHAEELKPVAYNHPELTVDLGVGLWAWPLPMDYDNDGDFDLVVSCPDKPSNGTYFFENATGETNPIFKPAVKIGPGHRNIRVSFVDDKPRVLVPGREFQYFLEHQFDRSESLPLKASQKQFPGKLRANQWHYVDYDGDGIQDLVVGIGDWSDYGWDDAYDSEGNWTNGPLRGFVYVLRNQGGDESPRYADPVKVKAGDKPVEVFGWPSPNFADFDGDGDLDLLCGEFLERFSYFENIGSRVKPVYASAKFLSREGEAIKMELQMIVPVAVDWDRDGDVDLICGDEDGRVAFVEHTGKVEDGMPQFRKPVYFRQQAEYVKYGALATPHGFDWDGDGDDDILCGNTAGYIGFIENLGMDSKSGAPRFAAPVHLEADGKVIRIQAGENGSIQGPAEAKWGYTTLTAGDWNRDRLPDLVVNSIWGAVLWYENVGTRTNPRLAAAQEIQVEWTAEPLKPSWVWWTPSEKQLVTQWRTTPVVVDWNKDGANDLVMLDHEGYLAFFERRKTGRDLKLLPGKRVFVDSDGNPLRLNPNRAGKSGRRKLHIVDWDGDGRLDLLVNSVNADWYRNVGTRDGKTVLENTGPLDDRKLAGHTSSPTTVDWNQDGAPDLLVGAEDGFLYFKANER